MARTRFAAVLLALLWCGAGWAGIDSSWSGEAGLPVPRKWAPVAVLSQHVSITLQPAVSYGPPDAIVRVTYRLKEASSAEEPLAVELNFPFFHSRLPSAEEAAQQGLPAYAKLDGAPVKVTYVSPAELARPVIEEQLAAAYEMIDELLEGRPKLRRKVQSLRARGGMRDEDWNEAKRELRVWMWGNPDYCLKGEWEASRVARGLLAPVLVDESVRPDREARQVETALRWLGAEYKWPDEYKRLSAEWNHETRLLDPRTGHLRDSRHISWRHWFGVYKIEIALQPGVEHELVVQHRQPLGWVGERIRQPGFVADFVGLRYVLDQEDPWYLKSELTVEVRVPENWQGVALRPPTTDVRRADGWRVHRLRFPGRRVEDLYVSVADWHG